MNRPHIFMAISLLVLTLSLSSCEGEPEGEKPIIRPVKYQQVFLSGSEQNRSFSGTCQSGTEINLSFRV